MAPRTPVAAAPAQPPRYSLLAAAQVLDTSEDRWQAGFAWEPEACGASGAMPATCDMDPEGRTAPAGGGREEGEPFYVWAADECSTLGSNARDWQGRARRQLEATQSFQIARELWTGTIAKDTGADTAYLADGLNVLGDPFENVTEAVVNLEAWALACSQGRRVMLHMSPYAFNLYLLASENHAVLSGNIVTTPLGSIVVSDAGYPGTPPDSLADNPDEWVYATPLVQVRLDAVEVLPGNLSEARAMAQGLNRPVNTATVWAQRLAAYQLDSCCRFAASTGVPRSPAPTPTS